MNRETVLACGAKETTMIELTMKTRKRLTGEDSGYTLIELLVVMIVIAILVAIAVPSYLGFEQQANESAAKANIRSAVPAVETYYADNGTYVGMDLADLQAIDAGIELDGVGAVSAVTFCVDATVNGSTWNKAGPGATIAAGACP